MISSPCRPEPNLIIGYTTRLHLLLDLDNTSYEKAERIAFLIMRKWPIVGDVLIVLSSYKELSLRLRYSWDGKPWIEREGPNYHLVFDNHIGYNNCCRICECLAVLGILNKDYVKIRTFRGDMTLRVSHQNKSDGSVKPHPEPKIKFYNRKKERKDGMILEYLRFLAAVRGLSPVADVVPEISAYCPAYEALEQDQEERREG